MWTNFGKRMKDTNLETNIIVLKMQFMLALSTILETWFPLILHVIQLDDCHELEKYFPFTFTQDWHIDPFIFYSWSNQLYQ